MLLEFFIQAQTKKKIAVDVSLHVAGYFTIVQSEVTFLVNYF